MSCGCQVEVIPDISDSLDEGSEKGKGETHPRRLKPPASQAGREMRADRSNGHTLQHHNSSPILRNTR